MKDTQLTPPRAVDQLLRIQNVAALTTLSKSCINLWVAQDRFPKPTTLSPTIKVWRASDISDWINDHYGTKGGDSHE
jgi:predicted DNA-binding transcriptional regulator AlpA